MLHILRFSHVCCYDVVPPAYGTAVVWLVHRTTLVCAEFSFLPARFIFAFFASFGVDSFWKNPFPKERCRGKKKLSAHSLTLWCFTAADGLNT